MIGAMLYQLSYEATDVVCFISHNINTHFFHGNI